MINEVGNKVQFKFVSHQSLNGERIVRLELLMQEAASAANLNAH